MSSEAESEQCPSTHEHACLLLHKPSFIQKKLHPWIFNLRSCAACHGTNMKLSGKGWWSPTSLKEGCVATMRLSWSYKRIQTLRKGCLARLHHDLFLLHQIWGLTRQSTWLLMNSPNPSSSAARLLIFAWFSKQKSSLKRFQEWPKDFKTTRW